MTAPDRTTRLAPLGPQRLRLLECLGGNDPRVPGYFDPAAGPDIFAAFRQYATALSSRWAGESDPNTISLLAAARFLTGDWQSARVIVDHLPSETVRLDHGAGVCLMVPLYALTTALPLPPDLRDTRTWLAGSLDQLSLRDWLSQHGDRLVWSETTGTYSLSAARG